MLTGSDAEGCGELQTTKKKTKRREAKEEEEESCCARALEAVR